MGGTKHKYSPVCTSGHLTLEITNKALLQELVKFESLDMFRHVFIMQNN